MWVFCLASAWLSGLLWLFSLDELPELGWSAATIVGSSALALLMVLALLRVDWHRWWSRWASLALIWSWIAWIVVGYGVWQSKERLGQRLDPEVTELTRSLVFEVLDLPVLVDRGRGFMRFEAVVRSENGELTSEPAPDAALDQKLAVGSRLWMIWPLSAGQSPQRMPSTYSADPRRIHPGQVWSAPVRLRTPVGQRNVYGFDLETWLFQKGIGLSGVVKTDASPPVLLDSLPSLQGRLDQLRHQIRERIRLSLEDGPYWGVMAGLVVGDQAAISTDDWRIFSMTGISHLVSISGMHVTMFALLARWLVAQLWRGLSQPPFRLGLWLPAPPVMAIAGVLAAVGYSLLAGFNIPAQRTAIMVTVMSVGLLIGEQSRPWRMLALTLFIVLLLDPTAVLAPGFWLSFVAVAILFSQPSGLPAWQSAIRAQLAISLALAPLGLGALGVCTIAGGYGVAVRAVVGQPAMACTTHLGRAARLPGCLVRTASSVWTISTGGAIIGFWSLDGQTSPASARRIRVACLRRGAGLSSTGENRLPGLALRYWADHGGHTCSRACHCRSARGVGPASANRSGGVSPRR